MNTTAASSMLGCLRRLAVLMAVLAGSAQAATYSGVWDPTYGAPFTGLGWRGTADYFVPDTCEPGGTADINNATACSGGAIVTSAEVELYDIGSPTSNLTTLVFDETSFVVGTLRYVGGALTQLTTNFSNTVYADADLSGYGVSSAVGFFLQFTLDGPRLGWIDCSCSYEDLQFTAASYGDGEGYCRTGFNDSVNFPPQFTITRVPEPGTLALACLALLALAPRRLRALLTTRR